MGKMKDVFSENPSSFKLDRISTFASKLKDTIAEKLNQFLLNYTDDVLAEYIVVLVCNGKDQNQAREDLEAFLGERSGEFVAWLWDLLLRYVDYSNMPMGSSYLDAAAFASNCDALVKKKHRLRLLRGHHHHANSNDEKEHCSSAFDQLVSSTDNEFSKGSECCYQGFNTSINEDNYIEGQTQTFKHGISKKLGPIEDNASDLLKLAPSRVEGFSGFSAGGEHSVLYGDETKKVSNHCDGLPSQCLYVPKKELPFSNFQPISRVTNVAGRRFSKHVDSVSYQKAKPRASVWDRLGKPHDDNRTARGKNAVHSDDVEKRIVENPEEEHDQNKLMLLVRGGRLKGRLTGEIPDPDNGSAAVTSVTSDDDNDGDCKRPEHNLNTICLAHHTDKYVKKRQFSEIGSGLCNGSVSLGESKYRHSQNMEAVKEFRRSSSDNYSHSESLSNISSGSRQTEGQHTCKASIPIGSEFVPGANNVSRRKVNGDTLDDTPRTLVSNRLVTESEPASNEDDTNTIVKPVEAKMLDYLDIKLRLHQMEMEMSKLKAKHLESNEGKSSSLSSSDALDHSDDDAESRTIFVSNVHFAATKEALSLHFAKCGLVVKIVILNDAVTGQPKGAAFITFAHKEFADKAVALSGTLFWSRTLKVVKKAEMPVVASALPQPAGNPSWSQSLHANRKVRFPRPRAGSLQWRRDDPVTTGQSSSAPGTAEQKGNESSSQLPNISYTNSSITKAEEECKGSPDEVRDEETQADVGI